MLLLVPLALAMIFMITAWTYYLRGWLATLMSNPRRRRTVIMCITIGFILLAQGPNFLFQRSSNASTGLHLAQHPPSQTPARGEK